MKWFVGLLALILLYSEPAWAQGFSVKSLELNIALGESQYSSKGFQIGSPQSSTPINGEMKISARRREIGRLTAGFWRAGGGGEGSGTQPGW